MIKILLFAELSEQAQSGELFIEAEGKSIVAFKDMLHSLYPELTISEATMIAVNEEYAEDDYVIQKEDVIALIPPVSGG
ncbi:molybdopterin converting factor subunit 1 [Alkalihalobacillus sp. 1P02AB]|uniref:molybdopterin converting factor subunit 1 n=1 Tax=Alkalihalobacillus sp. 1P02AB TaxID=3132260 RepID=UPI0039A4B6EE